MTTRAAIVPMFLLLAGLDIMGRPARAAERGAPDWVMQTASMAAPTYPAKVSSVVLLREEVVTVATDGSRVMRERGALRILQPGNDDVAAYRTYNAKTGRIRDFEGWLIPPSGKAVAFAKNRVVDEALSEGYTYDEARAKVLECGAAPPGSVFAWEITEEEKTVFTQDRFAFQTQAPVLVSRFSLNLPGRWEVKGTIFNHDQMEPRVLANTYTWELRDLPWIEREDYGPSLAALAPRLAVSYFPPADNRAGLQGLKDWTAVSTWLSTLIDPPAQATEAIRAKAAELTSNAPGELDKIRAIAKFTQQTNYVEVSLNITRGGGYTPHRADETLSRNYGDCKDKATLMRALLKAVGIEAYLTVIRADDRTYVRPEWASPMQFNHAIVAVHVTDAVKLPTVIGSAALGRLLIFDPTDPITAVGDLPEDEQGSLALIVAGAQGDLLAMPLLPASANRIESSIVGVLDPDGRLEAKIQRQYFGQSSVPLRGVELLRGGDELKRRFERSFGRRFAGATVGAVTTESNPSDNSILLNVNLAAERFGQNMQGRLFIVRPGLLNSGGDYSFNSKQRTAPIRLEADLRRDSIRIKLPAGFKLDELPEAAKLDSPYGALDARWTVRDGEIVMEQTLEVRDALVPASEYLKVKDFFEKVAGAQGAPVVLVKE